MVGICFLEKKPDTSNIKWKIKASTFSKTEIFFVSGGKVSCHGIHYIEQRGREIEEPGGQNYLPY